MNTKRKYVSPGIIRVKLEPSQAVLVACAPGATSLRSKGKAYCNTRHNCREARWSEDPANS